MQFFRPMNLSGKLVGGFNRFWKIFSQWEGSSHILWKIKNVPTTNQYIFVYPILDTHTHTAESNYLLWIGTLKWWGSRRMMHLLSFPLLFVGPSLLQATLFFMCVSKQCQTRGSCQGVKKNI
jgi:hypothetical protein